jgi:hypothetical protein
MTPFADVPKRVPILVLIPFLLDATQGLKAAELRIDAAAIERVVTSQFFTTAHQRHYVSGDENSKCDYAYLESPRTSARNGRIFMTVGLRARKAAEIGGTCVGPGDSRDVTFSALPIFDNGALGLKDIQLEAMSGLNFPGAQGLVRAFVKDSIPSTFRYDFRSDLQNAIAAAGAPQGIRLSLAEFSVRAIRAEANSVVCSFDFAFAVTRR